MLRILITFATIAVVLGCPFVCRLEAGVSHSSSGGRHGCCHEVLLLRPAQPKCCGQGDEMARLAASHALADQEFPGQAPAPAGHLPSSEGCTENCLCNGAVVDSSTNRVELQLDPLQSATCDMNPCRLPAAKSLLAEAIRATVKAVPPEYGHALRISIASLLF